MADFMGACRAAGYTQTDASDYPDMMAPADEKKPAEVKTTAQALMEFLNEKSR
jgi:hypothetical protein